jgi:hypothetical protein
VSAEIRGASHPQADPAVLTRELDGEAVLFDPRTGTVLHLNGSASAVWMLIDGRTSLAGVAAELARRFQTPVDVIQPEVGAAVADFETRGLLVRDDSPEGPAEPSPLLGLSVFPRPLELRITASPFRAWKGQVNLRAGDSVIGVEYDSARTARALRAAAGVLFTNASDLQGLAEVPAAFGVRTAAGGSTHRRVGIVHYGTDERYRRDSLDAAVGALLQALEDLATRRPGDVVTPFEVYARDGVAVVVDMLSVAEVDHDRLGRAGIAEVPSCAPSVDPRTGEVRAGGGTYRLAGIVEPWVVPDAPLDEVRRTVTSRVVGDQYAFALVVDALGERVTAASTVPGVGDVTAAVTRLLA